MNTHYTDLGYFTDPEFCYHTFSLPFYFFSCHTEVRVHSAATNLLDYGALDRAHAQSRNMR